MNPEEQSSTGASADSAIFVAAWSEHAGRRTAAPRRGAGRFAKEALFTLLPAALLFFAMRTVVQAREVEGPSMQPTFHTGQRLFITKYLTHGPRHGDVVVFEHVAPAPGDLIKRVIGMPGDHVTISGGRVSVNGALLDEPYLHGMPTTCAGRYCDITLGADQYYVMGDNRAVSYDSRAWGVLPADHVVGKPWLLFYPFSDFGISPGM